MSVPGGWRRELSRVLALGLAALGVTWLLRGAERAGWIARPEARALVSRQAVTPEEEPRYAMVDLEPSLRVDGDAIDWRLDFSDPFDAGELAPPWIARSDAWGVREGRLAADPGAGETILSLALPRLGDDVRITFWVRASDSRRHGFGAVAGLLLRQPLGGEPSPWLGYEVGLGVTPRVGSFLERGRTLLAESRVALDAGAWQQVRFQMLGPRYALEIDGRPVFSGVHARQVRRGEPTWLGLSAAWAPIEFDDLRIEVPLHPGAGSKNDPDLQSWRRQEASREEAERSAVTRRVAAIGEAEEPEEPSHSGPRRVHTAVRPQAARGEMPGQSRDEPKPSSQAAEAKPTPRLAPREPEIADDPWLPDPAPASPSGQGWRVVRGEEFERAELGPDWTVASGAWRIRRGRLRSTSQLEENIAIWSAVDFSADFRLAYAARNDKPSPDGVPCDLTLLAGLPARQPVDPRGGYLFRFGSYLNTLTGLSFGRYDLAVSDAPLIRPGVWHRIVVERRGRHFAMEIDGERVFSGEHPAAPNEPERSWGGFYVWKSVAEFDDLELSVPVSDGEASSVSGK